MTHQQEPECPEVRPRPHYPVLYLAQERQHHLPEGEAGRGQSGVSPEVITSLFCGMRGGANLKRLGGHRVK